MHSPSLGSKDVAESLFDSKNKLTSGRITNYWLNPKLNFFNDFLFTKLMAFMLLFSMNNSLIHVNLCMFKIYNSVLFTYNILRIFLCGNIKTYNLEQLAIIISNFYNGHIFNS